MLFINGTDDRLFPSLGVMDAYKQLPQTWRTQTHTTTRQIYGRQKATPDPTYWAQTGTLTTHLVAEAHRFNRRMQQEVIEWLKED